MDSEAVQWSHFPTELLNMIAKRLDTRTDVLRLRAVCSPWRSSLTPFPKNSPPFPIKLPYPIAPNAAINPNRRGHLALTESTIYYLEPLHPNASSSSSSSSKGWLVKVGEEKPGKMRLMDPLSKILVDLPPNSVPKVLNLLNVRITEVIKVYALQFDDLVKYPATDINELKSLIIRKVAMSSSPASTDGDDYVVMTIHTGGKLGYLKFGDRKWTLIDDGQQNSRYDDLVYHKEKFYAVDYKGRMIVIDSSLKFRVVPSPVRRCGLQYGGQFKHLVASFGDLFLVDKFLDADEEIYYDEEAGSAVYKQGDPDCPVHFKVYKLNDEENGWVEVKSLGGRAFFVGDDCSFSVLARDFPGCKGNCVYFSEPAFLEEEDDHLGYDSGIFDLENGIGGPLSTFPGYSKIFWPPPAWLKPKPRSSSRC